MDDGAIVAPVLGFTVHKYTALEFTWLYFTVGIPPKKMQNMGSLLPWISKIRFNEALDFLNLACLLTYQEQDHIETRDCFTIYICLINSDTWMTKILANNYNACLDDATFKKERKREWFLWASSLFQSYQILALHSVFSHCQHDWYIRWKHLVEIFPFVQFRKNPMHSVYICHYGFPRVLKYIWILPNSYTVFPVTASMTGTSDESIWWWFFNCHK